MSKLLDRSLNEVASRITGVIHFGAHVGQEADLYAEYGITRVAWVEPNPELHAALRANVERRGGVVVPVAVSGGNYRGTLHLDNQDGESSSLFRLGTHAQRYPTVTLPRSIDVPCCTIARIIDDYELYDCNFWYFDIQGAEAAALSAAKSALSFADFVFSEVQFEELYAGTGLIADVDSALRDFTCLAIEDLQYGWGEAFYKRIRHSGYDLYRRLSCQKERR